jgi:hypothetical protein
MAKKEGEASTPVRKRQQPLLVFFSGAVLLLLVLAVVLFKEKMTDTTFWVVRLVATLGAAGFGALIPGYLKIEGAGWKAGGAVAFGAMAYFFNPPPIDGTHHIQDINVHGIVYVDGKAQPNVDVKGNEIAQQSNTDIYGKFRFTVAEDKLPAAITFGIQYKQTDSTLRDIDTTIRFSKEEFSKPDFEIKLKSVPWPPAKYLLAGYVYSEQGNGLGGVSISANGNNSQTDDGGYFELYVITDRDRVPVNFSKSGFISKTYSFTLPNRSISVTLKK